MPNMQGEWTGQGTPGLLWEGIVPIVEILHLTSGHRLGLGTAPLGSIESGPLWWGPQDRAAAVATVRSAAQSGAAFIDTAPSYGWGRAEEIVRDGLSGLRSRPPLFTKCGTLRADDGKPYDDASSDAIRRDIERSRERLDVECIDVVQVHDPDPSVPIEDTWSTLMALREEGVIGGAGLSNHSVDLMDRALTVGPIAVVQHQYSLLYRVPHHEGVLDWCADHSVPFLAWSPLASGFLTDGFDLAPLHRDDLRRRLRWATRDADLVERIRLVTTEIAARHRTTVTAVAVAWATRDPGVFAIIGARSPDETALLGDPLPVLDLDDVAQLDAAHSPT
jgi:aryl-alcohol dehydrogenase-like predicted oxidoreductase